MAKATTPTTTPAEKREHAVSADIVASLADTFVASAGKLADRVRYVARIDRTASKAGEVVNWKALVDSIKAERPDAEGVSTASLSKARAAAAMLTGDDGLGRPLSGYRDSAVSDALRIVQDAPAETRGEIVKAARAAVAALPANAPAEAVADAVAESLEAGKVTARTAKRDAAAASLIKSNLARQAREEAAEAAEQAGRDAVAGIVAEVDATTMRSTAESLHVLDMLGVVAISLADTNDLGTLEAAEAAMRGMLADVARYRAAVAEAELADVI